MKYEVILRDGDMTIGCGEFDTIEEAIQMQGAFKEGKTTIEITE